MQCQSIIAATCIWAVLAAGTRLDDPSGAWGGRLETPELSARIELRLEREGTLWTGELSAFAPRELCAPALDLVVDDGALRFHASIAEAEVAFEGRFAEGFASGEIVVREGGAVFARGHFALARASAGEGGHALVEEWLASRAAAVDPRERDQVLGALALLLREKYVAPELGARLAEKVRTLEFAASLSPSAFASRLSDELFARSGDAHLKVKRAGRPVEDPDDGKAETRADRADLYEAERADNFGFRSIEILPGNIGYLDLRRLVRADLAGDTLAAAMAFLSNTEALIIDLRECGGGSPTLAAVLISYMVEGPMQRIADLHRRPENEIAQIWTLPWLPGKRYLDRDVFLLTAPRTFSAAEGLAFDLQAMKRATIVGERSGGGAHPSRWYPLSEHFAAMIPTTRVASAFVEGDWEGVGVAPDVEVDAPSALTRARALVLERRIAACTDTERRHELEGELEALGR